MSYFQQRSISNSALGYINPAQGGSPAKYKRFLDGQLNEPKTPSLERGDLLHKYMLEPDQFEVITLSKPPEGIMPIIEDVVRYASLEERGSNLEDYTDAIAASLLERDWQKNWKPETRLAKVLEAGTEYFKFRIESQGKLLIDHQTQSIVKECEHSLRMNDTAIRLLGQQTIGNHIVYHELEIYWRVTINGIEHECKSKIDKLILNKEKNTFSIVDLKTTSKHLYQYGDSFEFWRTYRQLAFYEDAVKFWLQDIVGTDKMKPGSHYIVAVMTIDPFLSRVFKIEQGWIDRGRLEYGDLLDRVGYHLTTGQWTQEREYEKCKGIYSLPCP